jgi:hypothetical protein
LQEISKRATAPDLLQHRWFQVAATAPAAALGAHMVKRLRAFAGMSRMKRLALVVLARTLTDNDVKRLRVRSGDDVTWLRRCKLARRGLLSRGQLHRNCTAGLLLCMISGHVATSGCDRADRVTAVHSRAAFKC